MAVLVLIVSPDTGFGGLIQQTLEKSGRFKAVMVSTGRQALEFARQIPVDLAILDEDVADLKISELGPALQVNSSEMRILLIPSEEPDYAQVAGRMRINGYLTKPFYLPDLVDIVDSALEDSDGAESERDIAGADEPPDEYTWESAEYVLPPQEAQNSSFEHASWLSSKTLAAQHLARLSMSTSSQAALILRQNQLWAYAGQLNQDSVQELAQLVQHNSGTSLLDARSSSERDADLARFVHLKSTGQEHLLYATSFERDMLLVLAFDARTPFSEIRNQANQLASALTSPPDAVLVERQELPQVTHADSLKTETASRHAAETDIERSVVPGWALEFDTEREEESGLEGKEFDQDSTQPVLISKPLEENPPSVSAMLFDLHYACILVPRLPDHYLIGDLSTSLSQWMRRLSLAFGWRLEYLALRPSWMQFIAGVEPEISAEHVVQQIRRSTSSLIFAEFPRFAAENPSADFWAPGYLVMTSTKPLPGEIVKEFTERTRLRQGISGEN